MNGYKNILPKEEIKLELINSDRYVELNHSQISKTVLIQKIVEIESEILRMNKLFTIENINNKILLNDLEELRIFNENTCNINENLIKSNKNNKKKIKKLENILLFFKNIKYENFNKFFESKLSLKRRFSKNLINRNGNINFLIFYNLTFLIYSKNL